MMAEQGERTLGTPMETELTLQAAEKLVTETVRHVELLADLATRFPELFKPVARQMPAWPVMQFKRGVGRDGFRHALVRLELAEDYPLDTSSNARSHPSSMTGQYLTRWVDRLHRLRLEAARPLVVEKGGSELTLDAFCNPWGGDCRDDSARAFRSLLRAALRLPVLTKDTSELWTRQVVVPLIMLVDAGSDEAACREPALKAIWRQRGVKSRATFRSRLLTKVRQTLRSLAKPG